MQEVMRAKQDATAVCYNAGTYLEGGPRLHSTGTDGMTPFRLARPRVTEIVKANPHLAQDEIVALAAAENIRVSQSTISHLRLQLRNGVDVSQDGMKPFHHVKPLMIAILKANPRASQDEIIALAAGQNIRISQSSVSSLRVQLRNGDEPEYYGARHAVRQVKALESIDAELAAKAAVLEHLFSEAKFEFTCDPATTARYARSIAASTSRIRHVVQILREQGRKA